jgi:A/G-specific adenine glycosylase
MPNHPLHTPVLAWYALHRRSLPWREPGCSPWGVLVSEVMLQQTPVARVLPVWQEWMARWPEPRDLASRPPGEAIRAWGRLGYPRRALRLHEAARAIVERHGGAVPDDHAALLDLPGIGSYTAAAVSTFAFGRRHAVSDTNVRRVLARAVGGRQFPAKAPTAAESRMIGRLVPDDPATAATWAVASMELGALICTARAPRCEACPVASVCRWRLEGAPPDQGPPRRGQRWAGTDRQVRGRILAVLRAAPGPVPATALARAVPDADLSDRGQRDRCLGGLVADGLVEPVGRGRYALPGVHPGEPAAGRSGRRD